MSAVNNAQAAINTILAELESKTGSLVESIALVDVDATCIGGDRQYLITGVEIKLCRPPSRDWAPQ